VDLNDNSFENGFGEFYNNNNAGNKQAGTYTYSDEGEWSKQP
jgi:hypothetical protein